jgi:hypothetical protein
MLGRGEAIRILVFNPISHLRYGDFEINLAAGLEDALIKDFDPPWNGRERGHAITEEAEREKSDEAAALPDVPLGHIVASSEEPATGRPTPTSVASFQIVLGEAYYQQGLINPGVEASRYLGDDGDRIEINFSDGSEAVFSRIDRKANKSGSVRVVGRNRLIARWFQAHFEKGDVVEARVVDRNHILLLAKPDRTRSVREG